MDYILGHDPQEGCLFCPTPGLTHDPARLMLHIDPAILVMMNKYPYNNGHLLVAPARHVGDTRELTAAETGRLWEGVNKTLACLTELMRPNGFNVGINLGAAAGAGVAAHLHVHVVPRWAGDTNFMTVVDDIRSIPEHIHTTYDRLRPLIVRAFGEG
jgi:ATP adenylyltransferase